MDIKNSARLSYRLLTANDAQLLFELDQDPAVMKYINGGKVHSIEYIKDIYLPRLNKFTNPTQGWGLWGVFMTESKQFIGWCKFLSVNLKLKKQADQAPMVSDQTNLRR
jgi:hypothetical protein